MKTALIEKSELGGTCLNNGCIPTKTLLHTADLYREMTNQADIIGLDYQALFFDMKKMQLYKQDVIQKLREGIAKLMKMHKVTIIKGCAKIVGEHEIAIQSDEKVENIEAKNILIATGSVPAMPPIKGAELTINSDELLNDENVYEQIAIIGGGVIGIELAKSKGLQFTDEDPQSNYPDALDTYRKETDITSMGTTVNHTDEGKEQRSHQTV